jgi:uridine kinase
VNVAPRENRSVPIEFSVSTWQQPMPPTPGAQRSEVLDELVEMIDARGDHRLRVAVDGLTAAGKTSLGHELARGLSGRGRPVFRASLDDFKRPWSERHLYDRESGEGYYRNAFDRDAPRSLPRRRAVVHRRVDPRSLVDVIVDNRDFDRPRLIRPAR